MAAEGIRHHPQPPVRIVDWRVTHDAKRSQDRVNTRIFREECGREGNPESGGQGAGPDSGSCDRRDPNAASGLAVSDPDDVGDWLRKGRVLPDESKRWEQFGERPPPVNWRRVSRVHSPLSLSVSWWRVCGEMQPFRIALAAGSG